MKGVLCVLKDSASFLEEGAHEENKEEKPEKPCFVIVLTYWHPPK